MTEPAQTIGETNDEAAAQPVRALMAAGVPLTILALFPYAPDPTDIKYLIVAWGVVAAAALLALKLSRSSRVPAPSLITTVLVAFLAVNLLSALMSGHVMNSLSEFRRWAIMFILYAVVSRSYRSPDDVWPLIIVTCWALTVASLYGFMQKFGFDPFPWASRDLLQYKQLPSTFGNPNFAGHALVLGVIMAAALAFRKETRWCGLLLAPMLAHVYLTHNRSAFVALAAAGSVVIVALVAERVVRAPGRAIAVTLATLALLGGAGIAAVMFVCQARTGSVLPVDESLLLRYEGYHGAARMMLDRPLLGWGPDNYQIENPRYWTPYEQRWFNASRKMNFHVHNDYLEAGIDAGIPGAALYIAFMACGVVLGLGLALRTENRDRRILGFALAALFAGFAADGALGFNVRVPVSRALIFILAGILNGLHETPREIGGRFPIFGSSNQKNGKAENREASPYFPARAIAGLLLGFALACALVESSVFTAQFFYQRAEGARYWKQNETALDCYRTGERFMPWNRNFSLEMGMVDMALNRPEAAAAQFRRTLELNPYEILASNWLGRACINQFAEALDAKAPDTPELENKLAGFLDEAEAAARRSLELSPYEAKARDVLARVWMARASRPAGDPENAAKAWRNALDECQAALPYELADPATLLRQTAQAHAKLGDINSAAAALGRVALLNRGDQDAWQRLYDFTAQQNCRDVFIDTVRHARWLEESRRPANAQLLASLARLEAQVRLERNPQDPDAALCTAAAAQWSAQPAQRP